MLKLNIKEHAIQMELYKSVNEDRKIYPTNSKRLMDSSVKNTQSNFYQVLQISRRDKKKCKRRGRPKSCL